MSFMSYSGNISESEVSETFRALSIQTELHKSKVSPGNL